MKDKLTTHRKSILIVSIYLLMYSFCFPKPVSASWEITGVMKRLPGGGCRIVFQTPMAVDLVVVSINSPEVFGGDKIGSAILLRSEHTTIVARPSEPFNDNFRIRPQETSTEWIELIPLLAESTKETLNIPVRFFIEGIDARLRTLETELNDIANETLQTQRQNACFQCHIALPLAWTSKLAESRNLKTPDETLASIAKDIISMQSSDGAFPADNHPEYGFVTPSLVAAVTLAYFYKLNADESIFDTLNKTAFFLAEHSDADGVPEFDFTFPPLFIGKPFAARMFVEIVETLRGIAQKCGKTLDTKLSDMSASASVFLKSDKPGFEKDLWRLFSIANPHPIETLDIDLPNPDAFFADLTGERDPELLALHEAVLREYGYSRTTDTIELDSNANLKRRLWRLFQLISREKRVR